MKNITTIVIILLSVSPVTKAQNSSASEQSDQVKIPEEFQKFADDTTEPNQQPKGFKNEQPIKGKPPKQRELSDYSEDEFFQLLAVLWNEGEHAGQPLPKLESIKFDSSKPQIYLIIDRIVQSQHYTVTDTFFVKIDGGQWQMWNKDPSKILCSGKIAENKASDKYIILKPEEGNCDFPIVFMKYQEQYWVLSTNSEGMMALALPVGQGHTDIGSFLPVEDHQEKAPQTEDSE